jgi:hypothetical protein
MPQKTAECYHPSLRVANVVTSVGDILGRRSKGRVSNDSGTAASRTISTTLLEVNTSRVGDGSKYLPSHGTWIDVPHWKHTAHVLQRIFGEFVTVATTLGSLEGVHYLVERSTTSDSFKQWFASAHEASALGLFVILSLRLWIYLARR